MEARRLQLGESWLIPESSFSKLMLPTPQVPSNTPITSNLSMMPPISEADLASKVNSSFESQNNKSSPNARSQFLTSSPKVKELKEVLDINLQETSADLEATSSNENDDIEVLSSSCNDEDSNIPSRFASSKEDFSDGDIYRYNAAHPKGDYQNLEEIEELESEEGIILFYFNHSAL